jgi:hypothetical protein
MAEKMNRNSPAKSGDYKTKVELARLPLIDENGGGPGSVVTKAASEKELGHGKNCHHRKPHSGRKFQNKPNFGRKCCRSNACHRLSFCAEIYLLMSLGKPVSHRCPHRPRNITLFGRAESSRSHRPRKKTSAPNTALATIASHKARGVVSWRIREMPRVQTTNKLRTTQTHTM